LTAGATLNIVDTKTGAASPGATTDLGAVLSGGVLSLNTKKVVDAADLTYVGLTLTATFNGVTSDPITIDISALFSATSTAGKLRTDKAKCPDISTNTGIMSSGFTGDKAMSPDVTLSAGVAITSTYGFGNCGGTGTIHADAGGSVLINFTTSPTTNGNMMFTDVPMTCNGTTYYRDFFIIVPDVT